MIKTYLYMKDAIFVKIEGTLNFLKPNRSCEKGVVEERSTRAMILKKLFNTTFTITRTEFIL